MALPYDYITAAFAYLIPQQPTYNGLPTNTHLLLDPANSLTQPLAVTEANVIYEARGPSLGLGPDYTMQAQQHRPFSPSCCRPWDHAAPSQQPVTWCLVCSYGQCWPGSLAAHQPS